jgi:hypothetical protein
MSLVVKSLWRELKLGGLRNKITKYNYIRPSYFIDWLRNLRKFLKNVFSHWKALVQSYLVTRIWLTWRVGNEEQVRIDLDPWIRCENLIKFPMEMLELIEEQGYYTLN